MSKPKHTPLDRLKHHVSGAIERGEKTAIEAVVATKHTPGPWRLDRNRTCEVESTTRAICCVFGADLYHIESTEENKANARLIAAAPELLENFEKAIRLIEHIQEKHGLVYEVTIRDGYKLIKKATGGAE